MRVLFDQNVPRNLLQYLPGHEVLTAANMGWQELENGHLLKAAESSGFDIFVTCDQNLRYQQNLTTRKIAIVELTKSNWPSIEPHTAHIASTVNECKPETYQTVQCPFVFKPRRRKNI